MEKSGIFCPVLPEGLPANLGGSPAGLDLARIGLPPHRNYYGPHTRQRLEARKAIGNLSSIHGKGENPLGICLNQSNPTYPSPEPQPRARGGHVHQNP